VVRVWGFEFSSLGFRVLAFRDLAFGFPVSSLGFGVSGFELRVLDSCFGCRISDFGFEVSSFEFGVSGFEFRVSRLGFGFWGFRIQLRV